MWRQQENLMEKLLSVVELASVLNISKSTLYKKVSARKIAHIKIGSRVLFSQNIIQKLLQENTRNSV